MRLLQICRPVWVTSLGYHNRTNSIWAQEYWNKILRPSYLQNGISYTGKTIFLYWNDVIWVWLTFIWSSCRLRIDGECGLWTAAQWEDQQPPWLLMAQYNTMSVMHLRSIKINIILTTNIRLDIKPLYTYIKFLLYEFGGNKEYIYIYIYIYMHLHMAC